MTIEEINALTVADVEEILLLRLNLLENPNDGTLETELEVYKEELIQEELKVWKQNLENIVDLRSVVSDLGMSVANLKILKKDLIKNRDVTNYQAILNQAPTTEARLLEENNKEAVKKNKLKDIKQKLKAKTATLEEIQEALFEVL